MTQLPWGTKVGCFGLCTLAPRGNSQRDLGANLLHCLHMLYVTRQLFLSVIVESRDWLKLPDSCMCIFPKEVSPS